MNHGNSKLIKERLRVALKKLEVELPGLQISFGNGGYYDKNIFYIGIEVCDSPMPAAQLKWNKWCKKFNLKEEDFGHRFQAMGAAWYTVCGIAPKATKRAVLAKREFDGEIFKFATQDIFDVFIRKDF